MTEPKHAKSEVEWRKSGAEYQMQEKAFYNGQEAGYIKYLGSFDGGFGGQVLAPGSSAWRWVDGQTQEEAKRQAEAIITGTVDWEAEYNKIGQELTEAMDEIDMLNDTISDYQYDLSERDRVLQMFYDRVSIPSEIDDLKNEIISLQGTLENWENGFAQQQLAKETQEKPDWWGAKVILHWTPPDEYDPEGRTNYLIFNEDDNCYYDNRANAWCQGDIDNFVIVIVAKK